MQRINESPSKRPLLVGDLREKLTTLLEKRGEHYSSFSLNVHVNGNPVEQNVHKVQVALGRHHLSAMGEYDAVVGSVEQIGNLFHARGLQNPIVVTDENVAKFHAEKLVAALRKAGYEPKVIMVSAGEEYKNLETVSFLWKSFLENGLDRKSTVMVQPVELSVRGRGSFADEEVMVIMKAAYTDDSLYFLFRWKDPTQSVTKEAWQFDGEKWTHLKGDEDRIALL